MWPVSYRRQGMLTQGSLPDSMCKLNISSYLTLPYLWDCLIFTRKEFCDHCIANIIDWEMGLVDSYQGVGGGQKVCIISRFAFLTCAFVFCSVISFVSFFKRLEDDSCCVCLCLLLVSFVSSLCNYELLGHRNCVCHLKLFIKSLSDHYSVDFLGKGRVF